jgi:SAM-dependent methyltransferase
MSCTAESIYTNGAYLDLTGGTWHLEDAPFKARDISRMLRRHPEIQPRSVCEIGCGAGGILAELQKALPSAAFTGYDISPHAHALSSQFANAQCRFVLGNAFSDDTFYDLVLVMDVIEHVEDCYGFLRQARDKGRLKLYHIPVMHASALLRGVDGFDEVGHIHLFTMETALKSISYTGHRTIDFFLTNGVLNTPSKTLKTQVANLVRRPLAAVSSDLCARLLGGYSLLILAE